MAFDLRECFPILEDSVSGFGVAPTRVQEGSSPSGVNGMMVLAFKDSGGNLVLPQLDASGRLPVTTNASEVYSFAQGELASGQLSTYATVATLSLVVNKLYAEVSATVSCTRTTRAQIIQNNNGSLTTLGDITIGAGQYDFTFAPPGMQITAGATGTQAIYVQAVNEDKASPIRATVGALQLN